jgi:UrcA family protein
MKTLSTLAAGAAATLVLCATSAFATETGEYSFSFYKSDLETTSGMERTLKKLDRYADQHCGVDHARSVGYRQKAEKCSAELQEEIIDKIDHSTLTNLFEESEFVASR